MKNPYQKATNEIYILLQNQDYIHVTQVGKILRKFGVGIKPKVFMGKYMYEDIEFTKVHGDRYYFLKSKILDIQ